MSAAETPSRRDKPWIFRTYAGHSTAEASNRLYRANLAKGQTGLSVAFDLPTQTGLDPDHALARGEVGKVGVSIAHIGDMRALFDGIPVDTMNTSMTINATAAWLLALYVAVAEEQGASRVTLSGTIQNDVIKEYLSRGTHVFPPAPSLRLTTETIAWCCRELPKWNPINVCSYHLQEAGATPVQEVAFALATAIAVLDNVRQSDDVADGAFAQAVGRISFFVNAGIKLITEIAKLRAFAELWDEVCRDRYGVADARLRRFRYGVQVNSLGLTEQQPENNVHRILLEMLAVVLSKTARARAVQLPAWNEALGLPRPWDQQWSIRMQQIVAYETDLLDHDDIFEGASVMAGKVESLKAAVRDELSRIAALGGAVAAVESGYMKAELVRSNTARLKAIEAGEQTVVGVNAFTDTEPSPLGGAEQAILTVSEHIELDLIAKLNAWRDCRDGAAVRRTLADLEAAASQGRNIMEPSIACARAGVTTGEWGDTLRRVFGEYRAPTGVSAVVAAECAAAAQPGTEAVRAAIAAVAGRLGEPPRLLVGKPGLDGHSNGAEQIAVRARECGMEAIYEGIRFTPAELVEAAAAARVHVVGLSILSGGHVPLVREVVNGLKNRGLDHVPVVVGGIIPQEDGHVLKQLGVARVYTPKDYRLTDIIADIVTLIR